MEKTEQAVYELAPGTRLCGGKYVVECKLGAGGFGITYKARQAGLDKIVCIKEYFLAGRCVRNGATCAISIQGGSTELYDKYREAFVREARLLATLHHPNIVEVVDVFDENNTSYMVMEYINGRSLQSIVEKGGPLKWPEAVNYIAQVANAAGYIHRRNILHRDIKPDNVMVTDDFKAILIDFGSARHYEHDKTQAHTAMLTHGYAPTEQYTTNSRKGSYTDIYAIGATLYFVLTGKVPLESAARLTEKMREPKEWNPSIPEEGNRTILKAMQIRPENRHQNIDDFMADLRNLKPSKLVDESIGAGNKKWIKIAVALAIVAVVCGVAAIFLFKDNKKTKTNTETIVIDNRPYTTESFGVDYPMIYVEGGTFTMGNNEMNEDECDCPEHEVSLSGYYIGQFEVSRKLWKEIMGYDPSEDEIDMGLSDEEIKKLPVVNITHQEAMEFAEKLSKKTGHKFSLPTEAQWEYAARGGNKSKGYYYAGYNVDNDDDIWYNEDHLRAADNENCKNELYLCNMSGNAAEWCLDSYDDSFYEKAKFNNPANIDYSVDKVVRGGSIASKENSKVSVYYRDWQDEEEGASYIGLRLVVNK